MAHKFEGFRSRGDGITTKSERKKIKAFFKLML